jgi:hypothetical protein
VLSRSSQKKSKKSRRFPVLDSARAEQDGTGGIAVKPFVGFVMYMKASSVPFALQSE